MGVSSNGGSAKPWVSILKLFDFGWFGGTPIYETHINQVKHVCVIYYIYIMWSDRSIEYHSLSRSIKAHIAFVPIGPAISVKMPVHERHPGSLASLVCSELAKVWKFATDVTVHEAKSVNWLHRFCKQDSSRHERTHFPMRLPWCTRIWPWGQTCVPIWTAFKSV